MVDFQIKYLVIREIEEQTSSSVEEKRKLGAKGPHFKSTKGMIHQPCSTQKALSPALLLPWLGELFTAPQNS